MPHNDFCEWALVDKLAFTCCGRCMLKLNGPFAFNQHAQIICKLPNLLILLRAKLSSICHSEHSALHYRSAA